MFKRQQKNKRPYRVKKTGIKDENIDRQIIVIHKAIAHKLLKRHQDGDPEFIELVQETLERRRDEGRMGYGEYLTWSSLLEIIDQQQAFLEGMIEDTPRMRKFRRRTPFVGILTEEERQAALEADALGTLDDIGVIF